MKNTRNFTSSNHSVTRVLNNYKTITNYLYQRADEKMKLLLTTGQLDV